ncbi:NAD(P)-dependent oxidoreductase [Thiotrichales bacterium 19S9-12]|nr:NAD(P)-dependent oxidoreductase [Thiotrichales bacterium 19S9-11]MCF6810958.1 NAD(P)-dependent oxidoreductase [Thiotrichales bacterium 19S9-12]
MKHKTAVITGATGYIGNFLTTKLLAQGWQVICIVRDVAKVHQKQFLWRNDVELVYYDGTALSLKKIDAWFADNENTHYGVVFHLASLATYDCPSELIDKMIESNINLGTHILQAMKGWNINKLINVGSYWQYNHVGAYDPVCLYAATKESFEAIVTFYALSFSFNVINLTLFDVYGPKDNRKKLLTYLKDSIHSKQIVKLSLGMQKLDMVYIDDVTDAFIIAAEKLLTTMIDTPVRYAVATRVRYTLREIINLYQAAIDVEFNLEWGALPYRKREVMNPWLPSEDQILENWQPQVSLKEGLELIKHIDEI